ncbi:hypothetical protein LguiA_011060 [Lonicera macranthoides]
MTNTTFKLIVLLPLFFWEADEDLIPSLATSIEAFLGSEDLVPSISGDLVFFEGPISLSEGLPPTLKGGQRV